MEKLELKHWLSDKSRGCSCRISKLASHVPCLESHSCCSSSSRTQHLLRFSSLFCSLRTPTYKWHTHDRSTDIHVHTYISWGCIKKKRDIRFNFYAESIERVKEKENLNEELQNFKMKFKLRIQQLDIEGQKQIHDNNNNPTIM